MTIEAQARAGSARRGLHSLGCAGALSALLVGAPLRAEDVARPSWQVPRLELFDGRFTLAPSGRLDLDAGSFAGQDVRPGFQSNVAVRRAEAGVRGQILPGLDYVFLWQFAPDAPGGQPDGGQVNEAQLAWSGLDWMTVRAGVFTPLHTLEASGGSFTQLFMERASIITIATSLASGSSRLAAGIELRGAGWFASAYATGGTTTTANDQQQRGLAGRAVVQPFDGTVRVALGVNGAVQTHPGTRSDESVRLRDYPELRISPNRFLDTRGIAASQAWAAGPELSGMIGPLLLAGEYQAIGVDADTGGGRRFAGWYAAASWPLLGAPRAWDARLGAWAKPETAGLDPAAGTWGWLELAGRFSRADLNDGPTRGGIQSIWTLGLNWYPEDRIRVTMQAESGLITGNGPDRPFQAVGWRVSIAL
jgi:phosphate-selective porin OprO/OprP